MSIVGQTSSYYTYWNINSQNQRPVKTLQNTSLTIPITLRIIASLFTWITFATLSYFKAMQRSTFVTTRSNLFSLFKLLIFTKVKPLTLIIGEKDIYILPSIVDSIMPLKIEETCRTAHRTHWRHERKSFAASIDCTCSTCLNCKICLLCQYFFTWSFRIIIFIVFFTYFQKICLTWWTGVLTPQSFDIDWADITSPRCTRKNTIYLF